MLLLKLCLGRPGPWIAQPASSHLFGQVEFTLLDSFFSGTAERKLSSFHFLVGRWESSPTDGTRSLKFRFVCVIKSPCLVKAVMHGMKMFEAFVLPCAWTVVVRVSVGPTMGCVRPVACFCSFSADCRYSFTLSFPAAPLILSRCFCVRVWVLL